MIFTMDENQIKKLKDWKESLPKIDNNSAGAIGGSYSYIFTPTGMGVILVVRRIDGHEINLTDFGSW